MKTRDKIRSLIKGADDFKEFCRRLGTTPDDLVKLSRKNGCSGALQALHLMRKNPQITTSVLSVLGIHGITYGDILHLGSEKYEDFLKVFDRTISNLIIAYAWSERRIIYHFSDEMMDVLINSDQKETSEVPVSILKQLPHDMFFIDYSLDYSVLWDDYFKTRHQNIGIMVTTIYDTNTVVITAFDLINRGTEMYSGSIFIDINSEKCIKDYVEDYVKDVYKEVDKKMGLYPKECHDAILLTKQLLKYLPAVLYLASKNAEIRKVPNLSNAPQSILKKDNKSKEDTPLTTEFVHKSQVNRFEVGEQFAINYRQFMASRGNTNKNDENNDIQRHGAKGVMKSPHERRGHWHHYWIGSDVNPEKNGPRRIEIRFQPPTFIHKDLEAMVRPTVIMVKEENNLNKEVLEEELEEER